VNGVPVWCLEHGEEMVRSTGQVAVGRDAVGVYIRFVCDAGVRAGTGDKHMVRLSTDDQTAGFLAAAGARDLRRIHRTPDTRPIPVQQHVVRPDELDDPARAVQISLTEDEIDEFARLSGQLQYLSSFAKNERRSPA
jgi:hypothetical protein